MVSAFFQRRVNKVTNSCRRCYFLCFLVSNNKSFAMLIAGKKVLIFIFMTIPTVDAGVTVDRKGRGLTSVPEDLDVRVTALDLSHNSIARLAKLSLRNLTFLQKLYLISNNMTAIEDRTFDNIVNLKILDLKLNKLAKIPISFGPAEFSLKKIYLDNALQVDAFINLTFTGFINLIHLTMKKNADLPNHVITTLPPSLQVMDMSECNLEYIPPGNMTNLKKLVLKDNHLQTVPDLYDLPLTSISLTGNPLECNKSLCWLRMWDLTKPRPLTLLGTCETPEELDGVQLQYVDPVALHCFEGNLFCRQVNIVGCFHIVCLSVCPGRSIDQSVDA